MDQSQKTVTKEAALGFYGFLFFLCHTWFFYYRPDVITGAAVISYIIQHVIIFSTFALIDMHIAGNRLKILLGGFAFFYMVQVLVNSILHSVTSLSIIESIRITTMGGLPSDFLLSANEAGFPPIALFGSILGILAIVLTGAMLYRFFFTIHISRKAAGFWFPAIIVILVNIFIAESAIGRNSDEYFSRREYPSYFELFNSSYKTIEIKISEKAIKHCDSKVIDSVKAPSNRKNVLFVVLESFRHDMINKDICPNLYNLSLDSIKFTKNYGDTIYTSLSWNILFMNRQPYTLFNDINSYRIQKKGSAILRIFNRAGYRTYLASSANFNWNKFYNRFTGADNNLTEYFCAYEKYPGRKRNELDTFTTEKAVSWIKDSRRTNNPFIIWVQLDSSHYKYFFDEEAAVFKPYPENIGLHHIIFPKYIGHVFNRYKNSARNVDIKIGQIVKALKDTGKYSNTAIIIVSDHGEGFAPGRIGHSVFHENIKKMALVMKLPGLEKRKIETPVSHTSIVPTLADYLQFRNLDKSILIGKSVLENTDRNRCVLTFLGSLTLAELNCFNCSALFRCNINNDRISFTPYRFLDSKGTIITEEDFSAKRDWQKIITDLLR
jgi:glucan phosphoethanolaminetransferase (alkaline phosphatase superfamily)